MSNFNPYFTNDGSVGLYSQAYDDVYHSTYGALSEAYEKFILPANFEKYFEKNNEIKILDLCFGIGYNTKSFLNFLIDFLTIDTIGSDNIINNDKIYTDNAKSFCHCEEHLKNATRQSNLCKIYIHVVEKNKILVQLSPFITCKNKIYKNNKLPFKNEKIEKMISEQTEPKYKLHEEINYLLLEKLKNVIDDDINPIIFDKKYAQYFERSIIDFYTLKKYRKDVLYNFKSLNAFLHNIYYRHISMSHKRAYKALKMLDLDFKVSIDDARAVLKNDTKKYNFVFLDAFTPTKCPCLWTLEFIKLLYEHLEDDGMILTYSNSAQVRHAMIDAGFEIYKNVIDEKPQGTIAVKNNETLRFAQDDNLSIQPPLLKRICGRTQVRIARKLSRLCRVGTKAKLSERGANSREGGGPRSGGGIWSEESNKILPLSQYELGLIHTKAGIYYRDERLNLSNEEILKIHDNEVKNSTLMSASKYKRDNLL